VICFVFLNGHLAPYLPGHVVGPEASSELCGSDLCIPKKSGAVAGAPFGSVAILPKSWMHIKMLGAVKLKSAVGISEEDASKRSQDFGFHSPTMSWPVAGTLMVELTESEDLAELLRVLHLGCVGINFGLLA